MILYLSYSKFWYQRNLLWILHDEKALVFTIKSQFQTRGPWTLTHSDESHCKILDQFTSLNAPLRVPGYPVSYRNTVLICQNLIKNVGGVFNRIWADIYHYIILYWTLTPKRVTWILHDLRIEHNSNKACHENA